MEDKSLICELLTTTLQQTRMFKDLESLTFEPSLEYVNAVFSDGNECKVNVRMDSGIALISDVIEVLRHQRG